MGLPQMWQAGSSRLMRARCLSRVALLRLARGIFYGEGRPLADG
jgi:hypothetical protein